MMKNKFFTVARLLFLLSVFGCTEYERKTENDKCRTVTPPTGIRQKAIFQKLIDELIDAIDKDDVHNRSAEIRRIYASELFAAYCDIRKKLYTLLEINATFLRMKPNFSKKSLSEYASAKKRLIKDLRELKEISESHISVGSEFHMFDYREKVIPLLEAIYEAYLMKFVYANKGMLTDAWFSFVRNSRENADHIPAGLSVAVAKREICRKNDEFGYEFLVFSLKDSDRKIVVFIEEREVISHMFLYDPKDGQKLQRINIDIKKYPSHFTPFFPFSFGVESSSIRDFNPKEIFLWAGGADSIVFDKENNVFLIGDGEYNFDYKLDLKNKTIRLIENKNRLFPGQR
jgi:hypothetical protein